MARILIVEDSRTQAAELRFVLESAGYTVEHAASAEDALVKFDPGGVDLVISDIVMPGMSGYELCRRLKGQQAGPGVPVMLLSSLSDPMDIVSGLECGADNFLTKPYDPDILLERVRTVLGNQAVRRSSQGEGIDVMFLGRRFQIRSGKEQILDLLLSTFEDVVHANRKLQESQAALSAAKQQLERHAEDLEQQVRIRTRKLDDQRRHLAEAQAIAKLGNWRLPCQSDALQWSDELYHIFHLEKSEDQVTLERVLSMIHPEDRGRIEEALRECRQTGVSHREEFRILRSDGEVRYCLTEIRSEIGPDGTRLALFGVCQDVTSLKLAEITANENAERYLGLVEALPDSVVVLSNDEIVFVNRPALRLLSAQDPADLMGRKIRELGSFQQEVLGKVRDTPPGSAGALREVQLKGPDGSLLEVEITSSLVDYNRMAATQLIIRDVTERNALARQMQQAMRMDAIGQLTGGVAHDFNNLLAVVMGNAELLREMLADGSEEAELTDEVLNAAGRGADLVRRLLAFARKQQLQPRAIGLNERLPDIVALLRRTLGEHIHIRIIPDPDLGMVNVDPAQVDDAILNLAINARDAMPGGGTLTIRTSNITLNEASPDKDGELAPGNYVMLEVSDTGTGMTPDVVARALEPFFTTKESGRGTGLGLSQVYGLVKQSGGHLKIESEPGRGTRIKIYLPRAASPGEADGRAHIEARELPTGAETILVVEDKPDVRQVVVRQLRELGYATLEAQDARHALDVLGAGTDVDLIFTDVLMPGGMTGVELARLAQQRWPEIRVLFTSGYAETADQTNGHLARNGHLLSKPYRKHELARAIRLILDTPGHTAGGH